MRSNTSQCEVVAISTNIFHKNKKNMIIMQRRHKIIKLTQITGLSLKDIDAIRKD